MKVFIGFVIGVLVTFVSIAVVGYGAVVSGAIPAGQDTPPLPMEKWAAKHALHAVMEHDATAKSPIAADEENLMAGVKVYASNCGGCHGTPGDKNPAFAHGFYPVPTLFADGDMVTDDPEGWTYWKVRHGIKWTGMPSFEKMLSDKQMWQVSLFLKNQDKLPPKVADYWNAVK